jgi:YVTN family beta-propeller protein
MGPHARAYAVLGTDHAKEIALQQGVEGDPQTSPQCLKCHTTAYHEPAGGQTESYWIYEGVGCEACHGAGSHYSPEDIMRDPEAAQAAGLKKPTAETCLGCHQNAHEHPFDVERAMQAIAHPSGATTVADAEPRYKTPLNLALHPDGRRLYVACEASDSVIVVDLQERRKTGEIGVGRQPHDVCFSPDGFRAYVSNRLDDSVSVIDVAGARVTATLPVGDEPHGVLTDAQGRALYVLNTSSDNISVIDTETLKEVRRLAASRNPWSLSLSPNGKRILVSNNLSRFVDVRTAPLSEVTVIDAETQQVTHRYEVPGANLLQGLAWHPDGRFALTTLNRTKNLVPMTRLLQGWTITNGLGLLWADGGVDQVLLDEPGGCFPDPADVAFTPDGQHAIVTSSGSNRVAVVDVSKLLELLASASAHEREHVFPNHLGKPTEFVIRHVETKHSPRGVLVTPDSRLAVVTNALDDSLSVIDLQSLGPAERIDLGGPKEITQARWGEQLFHSADITFQRQFSCHSCHPDGHVDGLTYDIEPDGIGIAPVDNRTLRGILDTAPFKWSGINPSLQRQCGPRLAVFFTRIDPFTPEELEALESYICRIPRPPNRYRSLGAPLTEAQRRGKQMFERVLTNDGRIIPKQQRCHVCHCPPLYTDRSSHDVGTFMDYDKDREYDTPHLNNIYDSAPYLHNGAAATLEEIWTIYNPEDKHGFTNDMTKDQLNDLIEYLKTL